MIGVVPPSEPAGNREPLEDGAVSKARDACLESGVIDGRTGISRRCNTRVEKGVPHDAEDCSCSCRVGSHSGLSRLERSFVVEGGGGEVSPATCTTINLSCRRPSFLIRPAAPTSRPCT